MDPKMILDDNYNTKEESFLYYLHEKNQFNSQSFWKLYDSILELGKCKDYEKLDIKCIRKINFVYKSILELFLYHMDSNDCYEIEDFPQDKYELYIERLDAVVDSYFSGNKIDDEMFELKRPL